ncbi:hypothetical protein Tco_0060097 [Tanacetum coccineum]
MAEYSQKWHNGTSTKNRSRMRAMQGTILQQGLSTSKKKGKLLKKLTTHSLVHLTNPEDSAEQQSQDSTNETMGTDNA